MTIANIIIGAVISIGFIIAISYFAITWYKGKQRKAEEKGRSFARSCSRLAEQLSKEQVSKYFKHRRGE